MDGTQVFLLVYVLHGARGVFCGCFYHLALDDRDAVSEYGIKYPLGARHKLPLAENLDLETPKLANPVRMAATATLIQLMDYKSTIAKPTARVCNRCHFYTGCFLGRGK